MLIQSYTLALTGDALASSYEKRSANRVETDGRHAKPGGTEMKTGNEDNVVRLPRDWLGPREDLIPFGPSAEAEAEDAGLATPPSTHDFWGEAGTHLWGPDPDHPAGGSGRRARAGWVASDALSRSIARLTGHPRAAWLSAIAVSCVAIVIVAVSGSGNHRPAAAAVSRHAHGHDRGGETQPGSRSGIASVPVASQEPRQPLAGGTPPGEASGQAPGRSPHGQASD